MTGMPIAERLSDLVNEWKDASYRLPRWDKDHHTYLNLALQLESELEKIAFEEKREAACQRSLP